MHIKLCLLLTLTSYCINAVEINEVFAWNHIEFKWPNDSIKSEALKTQEYIPNNNVPLGLMRWKNKMFVTVPRWKSGVAATLNYIEISENKSPLLIPYPSWDMNLLLNRKTLNDLSREVTLPVVSVMRVWIDACDRLWVLDNAKDNMLGGGPVVVQRSILIYNLNTDKLLRRYFFKKDDLQDTTFLGNIVVDVTRSTCDDAYAYIADLAGFSMIVYNMKENTSSKIKHLYFHPDPLSGEFNVGGVRTHWTDGVLGLALSDLHTDNYRTLYFHALTSTTQFEVSTRVLQNSTWSNDRLSFDDYRVTGQRGLKTQSTTSCFDEISGVIFYAQVNKNGLAMWNTNTILSPSTFSLVVENETLLEFPADIKIDDDRNIWMLTNKLPKFFYGEFDQVGANFRIVSISAKSITGIN